MKKLVAIILVAVMVLSFAGCGELMPPPTPPTPTTTTPTVEPTPTPTVTVTPTPTPTTSTKPSGGSGKPSFGDEDDQTNYWDGTVALTGNGTYTYNGVVPAFVASPAFFGTLNIGSEYNFGTIIFDMPNAHINFEGSAENLTVTTSATTFEAKSGAEIKSLTINGGNAIVTGKVDTISIPAENKTTTSLKVEMAKDSTVTDSGKTEITISGGNATKVTTSSSANPTIKNEAKGTVVQISGNSNPTIVATTTETYIKNDTENNVNAKKDGDENDAVLSESAMKDVIVKVESESVTHETIDKTTFDTVKEEIESKTDDTVALANSLTIPKGETLTINSGVNLEIKNDVALINYGTIVLNGTISNSGTLRNEGYFLDSGNNASAITNNGYILPYTDGSISYTWYIDKVSPYKVATVADLVALNNLVDIGITFEGQTVKQTANIDLTSIDEWNPIGNAVRSGKVIQADTNAFEGTYDGGNYTISNLKISLTPGEDYGIGLFSGSSYGVFKNINIKDVDINVPTSDATGSLLGIMGSDGCVIVDNCNLLSGTVSAKTAGGLVGKMAASGTIKNCSNNASIINSVSSGGIVGKAYYTKTEKVMTISSCENTGTISATYDAGGIVGFSAARIYDCENSGEISVGTGNAAGGIAGEQVEAGEVLRCENSGNISGNIAGGIVGWSRYTYAIGADAYDVQNVITIAENINKGAINANIEDSSCGYAGGIIGQIYDAGYVYYNENQSKDISGKTFVSGIVGGLQDLSQRAGSYELFVEYNISSATLDDIESTSCEDLYAYDNTKGKYTVANNFPSKAELDNFVATMWEASADISWYDETQNEFEISTPEQLAGVSLLSNRGTDFSCKTLTLKNDIDLSGKTWTSIANGSRDSSSPIFNIRFKGTFDGNDKTISGISVEENIDNMGASLFGIIDSATIKDLTVSDSQMKNTVDAAAGIVGIVIGEGTTTIENCKTTDSVEITGNSLGGIVSRLYASGDGVTNIIDCENNATIVSSAKAGGIACIIAKTGDVNVENCVNYGFVTAKTSGAGGIIGYVGAQGENKILNCTNYAPIGDGSNVYAGGIIGYTSNTAGTFTVEYCANEAEINVGSGIAQATTSGTGGIIGALLGTNTGTATIDSCENTGKVGWLDSENASTKSAGGIIGIVQDDNVTIIDCENSGDVSSYDVAGGIVGESVGITGLLTIQSCSSQTATLQTVNHDYKLNNESVEIGRAIGAIIGTAREHNLKLIEVEDFGDYELLANYYTNNADQEFTLEDCTINNAMDCTVNSKGLTLILKDTQLSDFAWHRAQLTLKASEDGDVTIKEGAKLEINSGTLVLAEGTSLVGQSGSQISFGENASCAMEIFYTEVGATASTSAKNTTYTWSVIDEANETYGWLANQVA